MIEQQLLITKHTINGLQLTFSFQLISTYNGRVETNEDTYTIEVDQEVTLSNLQEVVESSVEMQELKQTCSNAMLGLPLELPEGYGGE